MKKLIAMVSPDTSLCKGPWQLSLAWCCGIQVTTLYYVLLTTQSNRMCCVSNLQIFNDYEVIRS